MNRQLHHLRIVGNIRRRVQLGCWLLRSWSLTISLTLVAASSLTLHRQFAALVLLLVIGSWFADVYFLRQTLLLQLVEARDRARSEPEIDFSMNTAELDHQVAPWRELLFTRMPGLFHAALMVAVSGINIVIAWG